MLQYNNLKVLYMDDVNAYIHLYKNDIINNLIEREEEASEDAIYNEAEYMINDDYLSLADLIKEFDIKNNCKIYVDASLGLWRGVVHGHAVFNSLHNALFNHVEDINIIYFKNNRCTLQLDASHHDGSNNFKFYKIINNKKYAIKAEDLL